jgi:uncharacterized protein (TIGR00730 family)
VKSVCVYCGSNAGSDPVYAEAAKALAQTLAAHGLRVVYGGAHVGLMGLIADTALAGGAEVVGVIPKVLVEWEVAHTGLTELHVVENMHERKALMAELADAFVALPGGIGTLEELIEVYTWSQLGMHRKPLGVLNVNGYYDSLAAFLDEAVRERFLPAQHREVLIFEPDPETLLARMAGARPPTAEKWLTEAET